MLTVVTPVSAPPLLMVPSLGFGLVSFFVGDGPSNQRGPLLKQAPLGSNPAAPSAHPRPIAFSYAEPGRVSCSEVPSEKLLPPPKFLPRFWSTVATAKNPWPRAG